MNAEKDTPRISKIRRRHPSVYKNMDGDVVLKVHRIRAEQGKEAPL